MRVPSAALLPLVAALAACGTTGVSGDVLVGPGYTGSAVIAILLQRDDTGKIRALSQTAVGTAGADGGTFGYRFHSIDKGSYVVGAYLDVDGSRTPSPGEPFEWDPKQDLAIDPASDASARATADVYLARSAPGTGTIVGTVFTSENARKWPIQLIATTYVQDPVTLEGSYQAIKVFDVAAVADAPFVLNNVPPGDVVIVAVARVGDDEVETNDLIAFAEPNPVLVAGDATASGVEVWIDRQSPARGSLGGTISLNAPAVGVTAELRVLRPANPPATTSPTLVAWQYVTPAPGATTAAYTIPSLALGDYYVLAAVHLATPSKTLVGGTRLWPTQPGAAPATVALTSATPHRTDVDLALGVGRASGRIVVKNAPAALSLCEVAVFEAGTSNELFSVPFEGGASASVEACGGASSCFVSTYELVGLYDGEFQLFLRTDRDLDGTLENVDRDLDGTLDGPEDGAIRPGDPARVTVVAAERQGVDFTSDW